MSSKTIVSWLAAVTVTVSVCIAVSGAQTVTDAAREAREKQQGASGRVFTNKDVPPPKAPDQISVPSSAPARGPVSVTRHEITYEPFEGSTQRVIINATLNGRVQARMALDTGAPQTVIFPALAKRLGLINEGSSGVWTFAGGIGGSVPAIYTIIDTIRIGDVEQPFFPATIVPDIKSGFDGLIGLDFLSQFVFRIDPAQRLLILEDSVPTGPLYGQRNEQWWRSNFRQVADMLRTWREFASKLNNEIESSGAQPALVSRKTGAPWNLHATRFARRRVCRTG